MKDHCREHMRSDLDNYGKHPTSNFLNLNLSQKNNMSDTCLSFKNIRQSYFNNNLTVEKLFGHLIQKIENRFDKDHINFDRL